MLTVGQVLELAPGTTDNTTWINPGFTGKIELVSSFQAKSGKTFYNVTVVDPDNTNIAIHALFSKAPKFQEGQLVEFSGKGLRRQEYNNKPQFAVSDSTDIIVTEGGVRHHEARATAAPGRQPAARQPAAGSSGGPPAHRSNDGAAAASPAAAAPRSAPPPSSGGPQPIVNGQTVGMAVKEALPLVIMEYGGISGLSDIESPMLKPEFWGRVYEVASDIIHLSRLLESGRLAKPIKQRQPDWQEVEATHPGKPPARDPDHNPDLEAAENAPPEETGPTPEQQRKMDEEAEWALNEKKKKALAAAKTVTGSARYADGDVPF
jgi:hypothetical protein